MAHYHFLKDTGMPISENSELSVSNGYDHLPSGAEFSEPDDRYPGSFFRIPGVPSLGKTTWSLVE
jgi:hypothetical protein